MPVNMEMKSSLLWDDTKHAEITEIDIECHSKVRPLHSCDTRSLTSSPDAHPCYEQCCKDVNNIYQFCGRSFNFSANPMGGGTSEDDDYQPSAKKKITVTRDPMSHRIIEKRRRDRMNNCLADLSKLIPTEYMKKGRGRIEKTEIIEMAIRHMKYLQALTCTKVDQCGVNDNMHSGSIINEHFVNGVKVASDPELSPREHYKLGYQECVAESMRFLVELQGFFPSDTLCVKLISHLQKYYEKLTKGDKLVSNAVELMNSTPELETKRNNYVPNGISEMNDRNTTNSSDDSSQGNISSNGSINGSSNGSINGSSNGSLNSSSNGSIKSKTNNSHLREMLVSPHLNTVFIPTVRPNIIRLCSPEPSSLQNDSSNDNHSSNGSLYKFKSNIRERFEHSNGEKPSPSMIVYSSKRRSHSSDSTRSSSYLNEQLSEHYQSTSRPVPIFALHSKGSFYVPLTIDSHLLAPFVADLNNDYNTNMHGFSSLLLHPVTISVNFSRPSMQSNTLLPTSVSFSSRIQESSLLMVPECI